MDWYVYRDGHHICSLWTQSDGINYVNAQIRSWKCSGARGHPEYKLQYNPRGREMVWPAREFSACSEDYPSATETVLKSAYNCL